MIIAGLLGCALGLMLATWTRLLTPLLGSGLSQPLSTLSITTLVVTIALAGLVAGWLLHSRRSAPRPAMIAILSTAVLLLLPYALGDRLALLALLLQPMSTAGDGPRLVGWCLVATPLVLPAAMGWGWSFSRVLATTSTKLSFRRFGGSVACAGILVGWGVTHWGLFPSLTVIGVWRLVALMLLALATILLILAWRQRRPWKPLVGGASLAVLTLTLLRLPGPSPVSLHSPIGASALSSESFSGRNALRHWVEQEQRTIRWATDGVTSGVALAKRDGAELRIDGRPVGGLSDAPAEVMSGLIGAALHANPRRALVVGLGSGTSAGWLAAVPAIERVDVTEIEPALKRAAEAFAPLNHEALANPKLLFLHHRGLPPAADAGYDLILVNPSHPAHRSTALYQAAARRLAPNGLFLQHVPNGQAGTARAALEKVLPAVKTWRVQHNRVLLIAGANPIVPDLDHLRALVEREPYRGALDWLWGVEGLAGLLAGFESTMPAAEAYFETELGIERQRAVRQAAWGKTNIPNDPAYSAFLHGDLGRARIEWGTRGRQPSSPFDRLLIAETSAELADDRVPELVAPLRTQRPIETEVILARWQLRRRAPAAATRHLLTAFRAVRINPRVHVPTLRRALDLAVELSTQPGDRSKSSATELFDVLAEPFAVWLLDEARLRARIEIAATQSAARCAQAFEAFEPHPPWEDTFLRDRVACYRRTRHPLTKQARRDLATFNVHAPPRIEQGLLEGH